MSPTVEQIRKTVEARIRELQPAIDEFERLQGILALLEAPDAKLPEAAVGPVLGHGRRGSSPGRDGRAPQGANKRRIVETVLAHPGIAAPQIAELTGLRRTVVSATVTRLKRSGELEPFGNGVRVPQAAG